MEQTMELLKAMQDMMNANRENMKAEMKANREETMARLEAKMEIKQAKRDVNLKEMREEIKSGQVERRSTVIAIKEKLEDTIHSIRVWSKEMMACQEMTEARLEC
jgi:hypothetical protein